MTRAITIAISVILSLALLETVFACLAAMPRHEVTDLAAQSDSIPPSRPILEVSSVGRGRGAVKQDDGSYLSMSTDDLGTVEVRVISLLDDQTPAEQIGLRVINLNELSELGNQMVPAYDFRPFRYENSEYPQVRLSWIDGSQDRQEPIAEKFAVFAVDLAGNVSVEADTIVVSDPGRP